MSDQISTMLYGNQSERDGMFFCKIVNQPDWGSTNEENEKEQQQKSQQKNRHQPQDSTNQQQKNKPQKQQQQTSIPQPSKIHDTGFNCLPDPNFRQRDYSDDELKEHFVEFGKLTDLSDSGFSTNSTCDGLKLNPAENLDNAVRSSSQETSSSYFKSQSKTVLVRRL